MAYEPGLVRQIIEADINWTQKNKTRTAERAPDRKFEDTSDGQMWWDHAFLGDPNYSGATRLAFEGYSDDVDAPNPLGLAAGHHKLFLSFTVHRPRTLHL